jgi:hypothetical protein
MVAAPGFVATTVATGSRDGRAEESELEMAGLPIVATGCVRA